jgi:hypothetical protein
MPGCQRLTYHMSDKLPVILCNAVFAIQIEKYISLILLPVINVTKHVLNLIYVIM